jgi:hypothetical protein
MLKRSLWLALPPLLLAACQDDPTGVSASGLTALAAGAGVEHRAEQIVFSGTGAVEGSGPFGFWVWSQDEEANNPYAGEARGSVYVYGLGLTKGVEGDVEENADGSYTIHVESEDGAIIVDLTNVPPVVRGPHNTVRAEFTAPPIGTGVSETAVVNVTGPEEEEAE